MKLFLVLLMCLWHTSHAQVTLSQPVKTTSGLVTGRPSAKHGAVTEFLGIRFGETTAGSNRFLPPKRYRGSDIINATNFGNGCVSVVAAGITNVVPSLASTNNQRSEDCLFINVWTKLTSLAKPKPVLLWVYGGAFTTGDSAMPNLTGENLANYHDVVVVSFNYRLSVFGFPGAPGLEYLNPGLLDQRMAVEWTRDNIAAFGGDPDRITLFGESAGGSSVDYYAYAWPKDPIVNGFIIQSGTAMMSNLFKPAANKAEAWFKMSEKLGCGSSSSGTSSLDCVRNRTVQQIQSAIPSPNGTGFRSLVPAFAPTADEKTVFGDIYERARRGQFALKPALIGSNQNESTMFGGILSMMSMGKAPADPEGAAMMENDFHCGTAWTSKARKLHNVPIWRYLFANNKPGSLQGATHGEDVPFILGEPKSELARLFQQAWVAFAEDPTEGLTRLGWPKFDSKGDTLVRIAPDQRSEVDFVKYDRYDASCPKAKI